jgi:DNA mismatch repair protein MutS
MSTPLMRQYLQVKSKYPEAILLFRMGDFYETFEDDAKTTAKVLGITLTKRGNGAAGEVPLAGFPHHALEAYLPKLLKAGHRVAICEQLEDPKLAKGIVKRDVIEVVTPGVAFSEKVLEGRKNNFLASVALPHAVAGANDLVGYAYVDVTTGEFAVAECPLRQLRELVVNLQPSELLVQKRDRETIQELFGTAPAILMTTLDDWIFTPEYGTDTLTGHFKTQSLKGFGLETMAGGLVAAGAVMHYLQETQKAQLLHIRRIRPLAIGETMVLDPSTKRNLEINATTQGATEGSLHATLDRTVTAMGGRKIRQWINHPLLKAEQIRRRLEAVKHLHTEQRVLEEARTLLESVGDLERLVARIATERAMPREVIALSDTLRQIPDLRRLVVDAGAPALAEIGSSLDPMHEVVDEIGRAMNEDPPATLADGGVFRTGYHAELDELRSLAHSGKEWIATLQQTERTRTGISSLKVGYNSVFGYYIEVTNTHKDKIPDNYIRKQTLTNAERYITPELKEYEEKVLSAEERLLSLETRLFGELRQAIAAHAETIQRNAEAIATFDCYASFAATAREYGYVCPEVDESRELHIVAGRHPVIERVLPAGEQYTPNDTHVSPASDQILVITGPNMSGKSSYLRQVGLIVLLAQIGSFVPAVEARIGVVDKIYTRVGASDNIASGESTFLVEMHEAAHILNTATDRSLILLDEVGRGTSTFDGISIAWALTEYLHERVGAKTLFATHYHELNELAEHYARIKNYKVDVREYGDRVIFLHKVVPGFADHSYGIQVAQMAGLPEEVTERAKKLLKNLESSELVLGHGRGTSPGGTPEPGALQMTLFEAKDDELRRDLDDLDVDRLTPLEALQRLAELKRNAHR